MGGSAIFRENYQKDAVKTVKTTSSCGDKSGLFNSSETAYSNGNIEIVSDLITRRIVQTDNVETYRRNNISNTDGTDSVYTNGLNEGVYGSRMRIIGNPDVIYKGLHKAADLTKAEIIAARSGFNDDRNTSDFTPLSGFEDLPSEVLSALTCVPEDVATGDDAPLSVPGSNLFTAMAADVANEVSLLTTKIGKINTASQLEAAKLALKNKVEKQKKQLEVLKSLPESPSKKRILEEVGKGNLTALFSEPSNEKREKKSTYNKDEYEAKVAEILPEVIAIESQC